MFPQTGYSMSEWDTYTRLGYNLSHLSLTRETIYHFHVSFLQVSLRIWRQLLILFFLVYSMFELGTYARLGYILSDVIFLLDGKPFITFKVFLRIWRPLLIPFFLAYSMSEWTTSVRLYSFRGHLSMPLSVLREPTELTSIFFSKS